MHTLIHIYNNKETEAMNLQRDQGGVCRKGWKEEREGMKSCNYILVSKIEAKRKKVNRRMNLVLGKLRGKDLKFKASMDFRVSSRSI